MASIAKRPNPAPDPARMAARFDPGSAVTATETHVSVLLMMGDRVYKLKKPVSTGFLDFTARESRREACHREVELNRRFSPDVYLGVADMVDQDGLPFDHAVVMARMPDDRRLSTLIGAGEPAEGVLRDVAVLLARAHERSERSPTIDAAGTREALAQRWSRNSLEMARFVGEVLDPATAETVDSLSARYLAGRSELLRRRIADGHMVDGHGDLLADDIFSLPDGPRILDCLEFDDNLRRGDVLADAAFLAMDLERLERPDLAEMFLGAYRDATGDVPPRSLVHLYVAHRAQVRAKVACLRHEQGDPQAAEQARTLLRMSARHLVDGRVVLAMVGGLPGTGKSTLAAGIAGARGWTRLRSDEIRHQLADPGTGEQPAAAYARGIHSPEATERTYVELLRQAQRLLEAGESVVLDASWTDRRWRALAERRAALTHSDLVQLECRAPAVVAADRITARAGRGDDVSDATVEVAERMGEVAHPWPGATTIDTAGPAAEALRAALGVIAEAGGGNR